MHNAILHPPLPSKTRLSPVGTTPTTLARDTRHGHVYWPLPYGTNVRYKGFTPKVKGRQDLCSGDCSPTFLRPGMQLIPGHDIDKSMLRVLSHPLPPPQEINPSVQYLSTLLCTNHLPHLAIFIRPGHATIPSTLPAPVTYQTHQPSYAELVSADRPTTVLLFGDESSSYFPSTSLACLINLEPDPESSRARTGLTTQTHTTGRIAPLSLSTPVRQHTHTHTPPSVPFASPLFCPARSHATETETL